MDNEIYRRCEVPHFKLPPKQSPCHYTPVTLNAVKNLKIFHFFSICALT